MPRKIYDIKPPKTADKTKSALKGSSQTVEIKKRKTAPGVAHVHRGHAKKEERSSWKYIFFTILIVVIVVGTYLFFKLPKADISIWPKVDTLSFKQTITVDKSADSVDLSNNIIPAQYFQTVKTNSQDFPATGNASNEGQASGTITIYNKYDPPKTFTFKSGTHFMSDSGKLFVTLQKVVIPAAKKVGNKITPGSVQIKVQAVEGGTSYNIAPANFSVPGLKGTASYYSIYATSDSAMSGGYSGKVKKVTDDDIQTAKDVLTKKTNADAIADLKSQISSDYILLDNAILSNVSSASTQTKSGAVANTFNYSIKVNASALAFKKSDIDQFAKSYIASQSPQGKMLLENSYKVNYSASTVDVSGGKATINLDFSSGVYQVVDKNSLSLSIMGESPSQIRATISSSLGDQVSKVGITFWPFWVFSAPSNQKAINVSLKFQ